MTDVSRITFRTDTGEVRALLTAVTFMNFVQLFQTEVAMLQGAGPVQADGRREYVFTMPNDGRRELLEDFLTKAGLLSYYEVSLN